MYVLMIKARVNIRYILMNIAPKLIYLEFYGQSLIPVKETQETFYLKMWVCEELLKGINNHIGNRSVTFKTHIGIKKGIDSAVW